MQITQPENLLDTVKKLNPWFRDNLVPEKFLKPYTRDELITLVSTMGKTELATLLIGGRRVGKSVLMYQLIDHLLKTGVASKHILFVQGDNPVLREVEDDMNILNTVIRTYEKYVLDEDLSKSNSLIYIFLDEAQSLPNWDAEIKTLIDLKYPIKFFITGSSSTKLREGAQSPLVGRIRASILPPFGYRDFLDYELSIVRSVNISSSLKAIREYFYNALGHNSKEDITRALEDMAKLMSQYNTQELFEEYILYGGFPYVVEHRNSEDVSKYLKDILLMTFSRDILHEEQIREPMAFERLMVCICMNISGVFKYKSLAERVGLKDERTVRRYIDYYIDSHYVSISLPFSFTSKQESIGSANKKIYVIDNGLINTLLFKNQRDVSSDSAYRGVLIENLIHNVLLNYKQSITGSLYDTIPHWDNTKNHREIDFIFQPDGQVYPVEVKAKDTIRDEELIEMKAFLTNKKTSGLGFVVTNATREIRDNLIFVPAPMFALLV